MAQILARLLCAVCAAGGALMALAPAVRAAGRTLGPEVAGRYDPVPGGWHLHLTTDAAAAPAADGTAIGVRRPGPSPARRPLYPPADRRLVWSPDALKKIDRCSFRPLVMAYIRPRFLFDLHAAGGLLGHLYLGLAAENGPSKWLHEWSDVDVRYVDGRMDYTIQDDQFPGTRVTLSAAALADAVGLVVRIDVAGGPEAAALVWSYGGASAYSTNWNDQAREWSFAPEQCAKDRLQWRNHTLTLTRPFDQADVYHQQPFAAVHYLPAWQAVMRAGSSWRGAVGLGDPAAFGGAPAGLVASARWFPAGASAEQRDRVGLERIPLVAGRASGLVVVGMGGKIEDALADPARAYQSARKRNRRIADRIVISTPDPYLNAAMPMIAFSTDGIWGDLSILHGAFSWRLAYAEQLNLAIADYRAGRAEAAYKLLRGVLCGIYNDPTPGGLACHCYTDGRRRGNDEFADAISMWGRAVAEGMFGIVPKRADGVVELTPQFPLAWPRASIKTPHFSYVWQTGKGRVRIKWSSPVATSVSLHLPLRAASIERVRVDGKEADHRLDAGVDLSWLLLDTPPAARGVIEVHYTPAGLPPMEPLAVTRGDRFQLRLADYGARDWLDPQGLLRRTELVDGVLQGELRGAAGPALLLLAAGTHGCPTWRPLPLRIQPRRAQPQRVWSAPAVPRGDLRRWQLVDLGATFNASVSKVLGRVAAAARPPQLPAFAATFGYWQHYLTRRYHSDTGADRVCDAAWRHKVGPDGVAWTAAGIPFRTAKTGPNIGAVSLAGGFPAAVEFPVRSAGKSVYLLLSGMTFPAQSHVVNLRVTLKYAGGRQVPVDLVSPFGIGDCWSTWCGRWHDTPANGFENIGGRHGGPAGSAEVSDLTQPVDVKDAEAHLVALDLEPAAKLRAIRLEAVANGVVFGIMGASVLLPEAEE